MIKILLNQNRRLITEWDGAGRSVLSVAAGMGHIEIIKLSCADNPSILKTVNSDGWPIILLAVLNNQVEMIRTLVRIDPDVLFMEPPQVTMH